MPIAVRPFLMFQDGAASKALALYTSLFAGAEIVHIERYGPGEAGPQGTVRLATIRIAQQEIVCNDSPIRHAFDFTPSTSLFVNCASEEELASLFEGLAEGGQILMPLDNYGFSTRFGWINDRFGVSWQLNLE